MLGHAVMQSDDHVDFITSGYRHSTSGSNYSSKNVKAPKEKLAVMQSKNRPSLLVDIEDNLLAGPNTAALGLETGFCHPPLHRATARHYIEI